jgi:capsular exopolysaccharide synthesis family protein
VTTAQLTTVELKARKQAVEKAVQDPVSRAAFVSTELMKGRDGGDREYDEMRTLLVQSEILLSISKTTQASGNRGIVALEARDQNLREQIAQKEQRLAEAYVLELTTKIAAAEAQLSELRSALVAQQKQAMELGVRSAAHEKYAAELAELRKRSAALAERITQVSVNSTKVGPLPVRVAEPATVEPDPVKPQKKLVLLGALLVGGIAGIGLATLRERKDHRIRAPEEAVSLTAAPLLAMVPRIPRALSMSERGQLLRANGGTPAAEAYRSLRTALRLGAAGNARTVLVTSATSGDGKSTTASNLAIAMAQAGERTLLIDCDLRKPVQHRIFNLDGSPGLVDVLTAQAALGEAIQMVDTPNLYVLPSGATPADPSEQLGSKRFASVMQRVTATFDRVIIDAPPVVTVTDAQLLAASADLTLLVLRVNRTTRHLVRHCRDLLDRVGARVFGAVANDVPGAVANRYYGGSWPYGTAAVPTRATVALLPQPLTRRGVAAKACAAPPASDIDAINTAGDEEVR